MVRSCDVEGEGERLGGGICCNLLFSMVIMEIYKACPMQGAGWVWPNHVCLCSFSMLCIFRCRCDASIVTFVSSK